jgi:hypothetical protein
VLVKDPGAVTVAIEFVKTDNMQAKSAPSDVSIFTTLVMKKKAQPEARKIFDAIAAKPTVAN